MTTEVRDSRYEHLFPFISLIILVILSRELVESLTIACLQFEPSLVHPFLHQMTVNCSRVIRTLWFNSWSYSGLNYEWFSPSIIVHPRVYFAHLMMTEVTVLLPTCLAWRCRIGEWMLSS